MVDMRGAAGPLEKALKLMEEALAALDSDDSLDLVGARLQEAIDAARDHQSRAAPRA